MIENILNVDKSIASKLPKWATERMIDLDKIGNYFYMMKQFNQYTIIQVQQR